MKVKSKEVFLIFYASSEKKAGDILENTTEHEGRDGKKICFSFTFPATLSDDEIYKKLNKLKTDIKSIDPDGFFEKNQEILCTY